MQTRQRNHVLNYASGNGLEISNIQRPLPHGGIIL